jgi:hypothetical protein
VASLIHGSPEIEERLIQMPLVPRPRPPARELSGIWLAKLAIPLTNSFVGYYDPTRKGQFFDIAVAQAEAKVEPDAMADDLGREAVVLVAVDG